MAPTSPEHLRPFTLPEALAALAAPGARALAGGQALLPPLLGGLERAEVLVEIGHLAELRETARDADSFRIGAATRPVDLAETPILWTLAPALSEMAAAMGDPQFRNRATIGGAFVENAPFSCWMAAALALEARLSTDRREIDAADWSAGPYLSPLEPGETLVALSFRIPRRSGWARIRDPKRASPFPLASAFVVETQEGAARLALAGGGRGAFRWRAGEAVLTQRFAAESLEGLAPDPAETPGDERADAAHRAILAGRAARAAAAQAAGRRFAPAL